ncbi:hypothetical protein J7L87_00890 [bacterium]|nr:hypothetical protein [bacterium]
MKEKKVWKKIGKGAIILGGITLLCKRKEIVKCFKKKENREKVENILFQILSSFNVPKPEIPPTPLPSYLRGKKILKCLKNLT